MKLLINSRSRFNMSVEVDSEKEFLTGEPS